jgi:hypothetical protein
VTGRSTVRPSIVRSRRSGTNDTMPVTGTASCRGVGGPENVTVHGVPREVEPQRQGGLHEEHGGVAVGQDRSVRRHHDVPAAPTAVDAVERIVRMAEHHVLLLTPPREGVPVENDVPLQVRVVGGERRAREDGAPRGQGERAPGAGVRRERGARVEYRRTVRPHAYAVLIGHRPVVLADEGVYVAQGHRVARHHPTWLPHDQGLEAVDDEPVTGVRADAHGDGVSAQVRQSREDEMGRVDGHPPLCTGAPGRARAAVSRGRGPARRSGHRCPQSPPRGGRRRPG